MTSNWDYWAHASAALVGAGAAITAILLGAYVIDLVRRKRADRAERPPCDEANQATDEAEARQRDESIDEGKLRVAVRRSRENRDVDGIPFYVESDAPDPARAMPSGAALFEPAYDDTAAFRAVRAEMPRDYRLAEPPMIEGMTLFTYLKHHAPQNAPAAEWDAEGLGVWSSFVEAFYGAAGHDQRIAHKFEGVEMVDLKRHFLRALVTLTNTGLTVGQADRLGEQHAHLAITEQEFDAVTEHLVQTLKRYLTPRAFEHVLSQGNLTRAVTALRVRIVRPVRVA